MLVYSGRDLIPIGYTDSDFQSDKDSRKSTSGSVFIVGRHVSSALGQVGDCWGKCPKNTCC